MSDGYGQIAYGTPAAGGQAAINSISDGTSARLCTNALVANPTTNPANVNVVSGILGSVQAAGQGTAANTIRKAMATSGGATAIQSASGTVAAPVTFYFGADASRPVTIFEITIFASATTIPFQSSYFLNKSSALTNGCLLQVVSAGVTTTIATLKINEDFFAQLNNTDISNINYAGSTAILKASHLLSQPLVAASTDKVQLVVQDNLATSLYNATLFGSSYTYTLAAYVSGVKS